MENDQYYSSDIFLKKLKLYEDAINQRKSIYLESDELTDIAEYYHINGYLDKAIDTIDYALALFPGSTLPLVFKSRVELIKNNDAKKAFFYAELIEEKSDLEYYYIKAEIWIFNKELETAESFLKNIYKSLDDEYKEDFSIDIAQLYCDYGEYIHADYWLNFSTEKDSPEYREMKGKIAMSKGNYEESERIFQELLDEDPYSSPYWNQLSSSQFMHNNISGAIESSEFSIAINPEDEEALLNKANGMFSLGNFEEALKFYKRFSEHHQIDETGEMLQGITLTHLERNDEALKCFQQAELKATPNSSNLVEIYQEMAFTLSKLNRLDEALEYVEKGLLLSQTDKNELLVLKGHLLLEHGNIEEAQRSFMHALKESNNAPIIYFRVAVSVYDNGYINLAYYMFNKLIEIAPTEWTEGYAYLAICCHLLNKEEEFKEILAKVSIINPTEARSVLGHLFPTDLSPNLYYDYYINKEKEKEKEKE